MNSALVQISVAIGFLLFTIALVVGLVTDQPVFTAVWRALMVMLLGSIAVTLFFRFFARVLFRFIAEQQRLREEAERQEAEKGKEKKERERDRVAGRTP
jgi:Kef-type K+ transport system membrane component KefB